MFKQWRTMRFKRRVGKTRRHLTIDSVRGLLDQFSENETLTYQAYQGATFNVAMNYARVEIYLQKFHEFTDVVFERQFIRREIHTPELVYTNVDQYLTTKNDEPVTPDEALDVLRSVIERFHNALDDVTQKEKTYYNRHASALLDEAVRMLEWLWTFRP